MSVSLARATWVFIGALFALACAPAAAANDEDRKIIKANVDAYVKAYQKRDAAALAAFWSESGQFISPISGEVMSGRKKIEKEYADMFADAADVDLEVKIESLRFITSDVAVEEGIATVNYPGELPSESRYRVIHTKQEGKWLIDSIRETVLPIPAAREGDEDGGVVELKQLEWMIGDWIDEGEGSTIYLSSSWGMGRSFIKREFSVAVADRIEMDGIEVIGWDPAEKIFRSWVFDSEGGFGSAVWSGDGDVWKKQLTGTTKNGQKAFSSHTMTKVDHDTYQWRAYGRELDGKLLPNIDTVTVVRQAGGN